MRPFLFPVLPGIVQGLWIMYQEFLSNAAMPSFYYGLKSYQLQLNKIPIMLDNNLPKQHWFWKLTPQFENLLLTFFKLG